MMDMSKIKDLFKIGGDKVKNSLPELMKWLNENKEEIGKGVGKVVDHTSRKYDEAVVVVGKAWSELIEAINDDPTANVKIVHVDAETISTETVIKVTKENMVKGANEFLALKVKSEDMNVMDANRSMG